MVGPSLAPGPLPPVPALQGPCCAWVRCPEAAPCGRPPGATSACSGAARLPLWPGLEEDFERCRSHARAWEPPGAVAVQWPSILRIGRVRDVAREELLPLLWEAFSLPERQLLRVRAAGG